MNRFRIEPPHAENQFRRSVADAWQKNKQTNFGVSCILHSERHAFFVVMDRRVLVIGVPRLFSVTMRLVGSSQRFHSTLEVSEPTKLRTHQNTE